MHASASLCSASQTDPNPGGARAQTGYMVHTIARHICTCPGPLNLPQPQLSRAQAHTHHDHNPYDLRQLISTSISPDISRKGMKNCTPGRAIYVMKRYGIQGICYQFTIDGRSQRIRGLQNYKLVYFLRILIIAIINIVSLFIK